MKRLLTWVIDHPWPVIAAVVLLTAALALALPGIEVNTDFETYIDHEDPAYVAKERAEDRFGSSDILMIALVEPDGVFNVELLSVVEEMTLRLEALPGVDEVRSPLNSQLIEATDDSLLVGPVAPDEAAPQTAEELAAYRERVASSDMLTGIVVASDGQAVNILVTYAMDADGELLTRSITNIVDEYRDRYTFHMSGLPSTRVHGSVPARARGPHVWRRQQRLVR